MKRLIVIGGPTASGKTALAIRIASHFATHIISADSRQFYKELRIGVARPTPEELNAAPHEFVAFCSVANPLSAGQFAQMAHDRILDLFRNHDVVVAVGGSGLYLKALLHGLDELPSDQHLREQLIAQFQSEGLESLLNELKEKDPEYFAQVDKANHVRIIRALEVIRCSGRTYSSFRTGQLRSNPYSTEFYVLDMPREELYSRINERVDAMILEGLEEEVRMNAPWRNETSLQTVGYSEMFKWMDGHWTMDETIGKIKQHTRNYARRQLTWFRKQEGAVWGSAEEIYLLATRK